MAPEEEGCTRTGIFRLLKQTLSFNLWG